MSDTTEGEKAEYDPWAASVPRDWVGSTARVATTASTDGLARPGAADGLRAFAGPAATDAVIDSAHDGAAQDWRDIQHVLSGDDDAFRRVIERHQRRVAAMMWRFSRDPNAHEELVADAFVEVYESLPKYRPEAPFENWLSRIATRVGYRFWRTQRRKRRLDTVPLEDWHVVATDGPEALGADDAAEVLYRLLESLAPRDRLVLTLRYVEGRSVAETAQLTGWSESMVKVQALRARKKLRKLFGDVAEEADL